MATALEKRLEARGVQQVHGGVHHKTLHEREGAALNCKVNFIFHHPVLKPLRIVSNINYSGHSYNSILAKGPNSIQPLFSIFIQFRSYEKVCIWDLSKAYSQIVTGPEELHIRRLVWRWGEEEGVYIGGSSKMKITCLFFWFS